jgi:HAD superfamily hydrolase (TIGR01509 family)
MPLEAVMFDMDGLLIDTEPIWMRAEFDLVTEWGGTWTPADQEAILGSSLPFASQYIKDRCSTSLSPKQVGRALYERFREYLAQTELVVQPGAMDLVGSVAAAGLPFALVSASERSIMDMITSRLYRRGMAEFPVTVAGDEVERGKPDPLPYLTAAALMGADPTSCVVLEDSRNGVQSGWSAGATVVALAHMVDHDPRERVHVRDSLVGLDALALMALVTN